MRVTTTKLFGGLLPACQNLLLFTMMTMMMMMMATTTSYVNALGSIEFCGDQYLYRPNTELTLIQEIQEPEFETLDEHIYQSLGSLSTAFTAFYRDPCTTYNVTGKTYYRLQNDVINDKMGSKSFVIGDDGKTVVMCRNQATLITAPSIGKVDILYSGSVEIYQVTESTSPGKSHTISKVCTKEYNNCPACRLASCSSCGIDATFSLCFESDTTKASDCTEPNGWYILTPRSDEDVTKCSSAVCATNELSPLLSASSESAGTATSIQLWGRGGSFFMMMMVPMALFMLT